jgi:hypothetical protein
MTLNDLTPAKKVGRSLLSDSTTAPGIKLNPPNLERSERDGCGSRPTGSPRLRPGFRASRPRRDAALRERAAERFCEVAQSITRYAGGLTLYPTEALLKQFDIRDE